MSSSRKKQKSVRLFFTGEQYRVLEEFQKMINAGQTGSLNMSKLCRQAVFYAISDSRKRAAEELAIQKQELENGNATTGDTGSNTAETPTSPSTNPDTLANTEASGDSSPPSQ